MQDNLKHSRWEDLISECKETKKNESLNKDILDIIS